MKNELRLAGLLPLKVDFDKDRPDLAAEQIIRVCDHFIVLHDRPESDVAIRPVPTEELISTGGDGAWNDWVNRMTLLVRAAKYGCRWVMWLDADEELGPTLNRERVRELIEQADAQGHVVVTVRVRTAWNESEWRTDGIFANQRKPLFQLNPLMLKSPVFHHGPEKRLHAFPRLDGTVMHAEDHIIHWGMRTRSIREKNVAKYAKADPKNEFSAVRYDYLLNEAGMKLQPLVDPPRFLFILPTRGRPWGALRAISSVMQTASRPDNIDILICQDDDDPQIFTLTHRRIECLFRPRKRFIGWMNTALLYRKLHPYTFVGWLSDDVVFSTKGWDEMAAEHKELLVYGDDGYQGGQMPTFPFLRTELLKAVGGFPDKLVHLCADLFVECIASEVGSIAYDPRIKTEHLHWAAKKSAQDQTYKDGLAHWKSDQATFDEDIRATIPKLAQQVKDYAEREGLQICFQRYRHK